MYPCTPSGDVRCSCECLWVIIHPIPTVCKLPAINFIIALYGVPCFLFWSQSSFSVRRLLFNISASQQESIARQTNTCQNLIIVEKGTSKFRQPVVSTTKSLESQLILHVTHVLIFFVSTFFYLKYRPSFRLYQMVL